MRTKFTPSLYMISASPLESIDPIFLTNFTLVSLTVLGAGVAIASLWSVFRLRPPHETPTRREFDSLAKKVDHIESTLDPMERRILAAVSLSGKEITAQIRSVAADDHEGRTRIWEKLHAENNKIVGRMATIEARQEKS